MYSNVTPPALPSYDSVANPYYLIQFEYAIGAENWETVRFWYGAAPLTWNGSAVTNSADCYLYTWGTGSQEWTAWGFMAEAGEMALKPGVTTADTYMRLYTNHDTLDANGKVWLAEGTVTPTEADKEAEIQIRIKSKLAGIIAAWCAPVRQFQKPTAEPVAFLYGPDKVRLPGLPVVEYPVKVINYYPGTQEYIFAAYESQNYFESYGKTLFGNKDGVPKVALFATTGEEWESFEQEWNFCVDKGHADLADAPVVWTNFDLKYSDGTLYSAKSEPVPVYE